jgi:hypothetical protein
MHMGLHLNYELRLLGSASIEHVDRVLGALHAFASTLPFAEVTPVANADREAWLEFWASLIAEPHDEEGPRLIGDTDTARGFLVNAGRGCETATFGFLFRADSAAAHGEWFWYCSCKTQYAAVVNDDHLVICHTSLVAVLDHAITLGVDVTVRDETHYWETRDSGRLVDEVRAMNGIIAAIAGKLSDAMGPEHTLQAPIFDHPNFERLEMGE